VIASPRGQVLFSDRKTEGVHFTAPVAGTVTAINRGVKRVLLSVVIDVDGDAEREFTRYEAARLGALSREQVRDNLTASGLWTALRTRPYSKVPAPASVPHAIFVSVIDTHPLAADPLVALGGQAQDFGYGVQVLGALTDGKVYVVGRAGAATPRAEGPRVVHEEFAGPHPAGLAGTHIHFLDPVHEQKTVWTIGCQDVAAIGRLFTTGRLSSERVVALAGPGVQQPRLLRTVLGASADELCAGQLLPGEQRIVSGSVLGGRRASGATNGSPRAMVPIGMYERSCRSTSTRPSCCARCSSATPTARPARRARARRGGPGAVHLRRPRQGRLRGRPAQEPQRDRERGLIPMQFLRNLLDKAEKPFHKGGKLEKLYPLYEATDTFLYTPGTSPRRPRTCATRSTSSA
jgi:Na+-transporting NADH:ubiquinone oxidoreductase subunit NqrA